VFRGFRGFVTILVLLLLQVQWTQFALADHPGHGGSLVAHHGLDPQAVPAKANALAPRLDASFPCGKEDPPCTGGLPVASSPCVIPHAVHIQPAQSIARASVAKGFESCGPPSA